jgi:hypothetical protein
METLSRACDRGVTPFATDSAMSESDLGWRRGDAEDGGGDRAGPSAERRQGAATTPAGGLLLVVVAVPTGRD